MAAIGGQNVQSEHFGEVALVAADQSPKFADLDRVMGQLSRKIEVLKFKITENEERKEKLIFKIENHTLRHKRVKLRVERRLAQVREYEKTIEATQNAYDKIVQSSSTLLDVLVGQVGDPEEDEAVDMDPTNTNSNKRV